MIPSTRGVARRLDLQCRRLATSARPGKPATPRPFKPNPRSGGSNIIPPPPPPPPPPPKPETLLDLWRASWLPLSGAALLAGCLGFYLLGTATASLKQQSPSQSPSTPSASACEHFAPTGRPPALTGDNADRFDKELDLPEWWMGVTKLRKRLAREASGHVLEVAVGSGRNLAHYPWHARASAGGVLSFTGLDISPDMLDVSRRKLARLAPPSSSSVRRVRLLRGDAHDTLPPPSGDQFYDTITQTFGLCSVADPVSVLANLAAAVRPGTGRIILLEHGKGWYGLVNGLLDRNADKHFAKYGCWWNRDIEALVEEAARRTPGLEIVKVERPNVTQMGTLLWIELKVAPDGLKAT